MYSKYFAANAENANALAVLLVANEATRNFHKNGYFFRGYKHVQKHKKEQRMATKITYAVMIVFKHIALFCTAVF